MSTKDFRASQIETSKIIGTGSISGTTVGIAIYSGSIANNREGGTSDAAMFNNVGSDVFLFVSGTRSNNNFSRTNSTLFGGDVVISGTLYAERQVIEVDSIADGNFFVTGNLYVEPDSNSTESVAFRKADGTNIFIVDSTNSRIGVGVSDPDSQVEIFGTSTQLKLSNNAADFATFAVGTHGDLTITTFDANAGAANFVIDADGAVDIDADAGALSLDGSAGINIGTETDVAIDINASTLDIDASGALTIDSATSISIGTNADKPVTIESTTLDVNSSGAITIDSTSTFSVDAVGTSNITTNGALTLSGSTGLNIAAHSGEIDVTATQGNIDVNAIAGTIDIDSGGALTIDSATSIYIGGTADKPVSIDSTAFALDASTTVAIDGVGISIDSTGDSNITVTGTAVVPKDLDIAVVGGNTQELRLASAGTGASALHLNATAGGVNIDANNNITLDGDRLLISDPSSPGTDTLFSVSGSIGSKSTATKGTSVFGGDIVISGGLYVNETIFSANDTDTKIVFSDDQIDFFAGNERLLKLDETADDEVVIGDGGDVNFRVATKGYGYNLYVKSEHNAGAENAVSIRHASPQEVLHVSGAIRIDSEGRPNVLFVSGTVGTNSHQVLILSGGSGASTDESAGTDIAFYVSGTVGSKGTATKGTSLFGGDVMISGSTTIGSSLSVSGDLLPSVDDTHDLGSASLAWQDLFLEGDITLTDAGSVLTTAGDISITAANGGSDVVIKGDLVPQADDTYDLGTTSLAWQDLHLEGDILMTDAGKLETTTGDLTVSSADGQVIIDAETDIVLDAKGDDIIIKDNGTIKGSIIANSRLTISSSAGNDLAFDSNAGDFRFEQAGSEYFRIKKSSSDTVLQPKVTAGDIIFQEDGGNEIARFDSNVEGFAINTNKKITFDGATSQTEFISGDGTNIQIGSSNSVLIMSGGAAASTIPNGVDVNFFVSGTIGSAFSAVRGTSLLGGDLVVSGNTKFHNHVVMGGTTASRLYFDSVGAPGGTTNGPFIGGNSVALTLDGDNRLLFSFDDDILISDQNVTVIKVLDRAAASSKEAQLDANIVFSGSVGSRGTSTRGTVIFGGDSVTSGSLAKVDSVDGSLCFEVDNAGINMPPNKTINLGDPGENIKGDGTDLFISSSRKAYIVSAADAIHLDSQDGKTKFDKGGTEYFRINRSSGDVQLQPKETNKDIIFLEDGGDEVFRVDSSAKDILMVAGNNVSFGAATRFIGDGTDYNSTANDLVIVGSNNVILGPGAGSQAFVALGTSGQFVVADGAGPTNYLMMTGSGLGGILSSSVHNKNIAIHSNNAKESFSILGTGGAVFNDPGPAGADVIFVVSGAKGSQSTTTKGTSMFGGDVFVSGSTHIATGSTNQGLFLRSPDGSVFRVNVANDGGLTATKEG